MVIYQKILAAALLLVPLEPQLVVAAAEYQPIVAVLPAFPASSSGCGTTYLRCSKNLALASSSDRDSDV